MTPSRVALILDYLEEDWPSMELVGRMVLEHLQEGHAAEFPVERVCPPYRHRAARWPAVGGKESARNADRLLNRYWDYPRALSRLVRERGREFALYHVVDHSYAQLVHEVPPGRAVVTCHDLDGFRCVLEPGKEPRPRWFRSMVGRGLSGFRRAAAIACVSAATREAVLGHGLLPADRVHLVPYGISPEFTPAPDPAADAEAERLLGPPGPADLLHVGSNVARKRVDVALAVLAVVRRSEPGARLLKVGGALTPGQARVAEDLGVADAVVTVPNVPTTDRATMAAVYRRAALVLQPSEAEGFGLPAAEALACGVPLLASDIPALREVGGDAPVYRPVGDVPAWSEAALALLGERGRGTPSWLERRARGLATARRYSWAGHAGRLAAVYRDVLSRPP